MYNMQGNSLILSYLSQMYATAVVINTNGKNFCDLLKSKFSAQTVSTYPRIDQIDHCYRDNSNRLGSRGSKVRIYY